MKTFKITSFFFTVAFLCAMGLSAQNKAMRIYKGGNMVQAIDIAEIDSINFYDFLYAPLNIAAVLEGDAITITWGSVTDAANYEVYRSNDNLAYTLLQSGITATSYTDNEPLEGYNYYKIKAAGVGLVSEFSATSIPVPYSVIGSVVINGVTWATCNVDSPGGFVASPEIYGERYDWTQAENVCPTGWRLPTSQEFQQLFSTGSAWTTVNGIYGRCFGSDSNIVFLPVAGYTSDSYVGEYGVYWSSTEYGENSMQYLIFNNNNIYMSYTGRMDGRSVRCVAE